MAKIRDFVHVARDAKQSLGRQYKRVDALREIDVVTNEDEGNLEQSLRLEVIRTRTTALAVGISLLHTALDELGDSRNTHINRGLTRVRACIEVMRLGGVTAPNYRRNRKKNTPIADIQSQLARLSDIDDKD